MNDENIALLMPHRDKATISPNWTKRDWTSSQLRTQCGIVCESPLSLVVPCRNRPSNNLLLVFVSRYLDMEQTLSKRDSSSAQKSSLCHHHHKQVRELLYLSNDFSNNGHHV